MEYLLVPVAIGILIAVVNFFTTKERDLNGKHVLVSLFVEDAEYYLG